MKNNVLYVNKGEVRIVEKAMPVAKEGFVVIKIHIAPICIEQRVYETGFIEWHEDHDMLGHEGVGEVWDVGPGVTNVRKGDRVIVFQGWTCGECYVCENGLGSTHCQNLKGPKDIEEFNESESGGAGYAQYRLAPANMVSKLPDNLSYKHASAGNCLIGCTYTAMREHHISPEHYCLVAGIGFVGHATIVNLKYRGSKIIALGRTKTRMDMAKELGADYIINPNDEDWLEQIKACTPQSRGVDFSFECSGYPYYQRKCLDALRHYGTMVQLGYAAHEDNLKFELNTEWDLCWGHKHITASFDVAFNDRQALLEVLQDPWIQQQVDKMVTHQFPMSQAEEAFQTILEKKACKVHLLPQL